MSPFRTILIAADFSESSREAFRVACSLARGDEARVRILHALEAEQVAEEPVDLGQPTTQFTAVGRGQGSQEAVKERLRQFYAPVRPIEVEYATRDGSPAEEIRRAAEWDTLGLPDPRVDLRARERVARAWTAPDSST